MLPDTHKKVGGYMDLTECCPHVPIMHFWPGSVKNEGSVLPSSKSFNITIQWKLFHTISKIS